MAHVVCLHAVVCFLGFDRESRPCRQLGMNLLSRPILDAFIQGIECHRFIGRLRRRFIHGIRICILLGSFIWI